MVGLLDSYKTSKKHGQLQEIVFAHVFVLNIFSGFETQTIPIELNVSGCPLAFQVAHDKDQAAMVRYGSHLEGGPNVPRKLRINNKSPHGNLLSSAYIAGLTHAIILNQVCNIGYIIAPAME